MDIPEKALEVVVAGKVNGWKVQLEALFTPRRTIITATSPDKSTVITAVWNIDGNWDSGSLNNTNRYKPRLIRNAGEAKRIMEGRA